MHTIVEDKNGNNRRAHLKWNSTGLVRNKGFRKRDQNIVIYDNFDKDDIEIKVIEYWELSRKEY